MVFKILLLLSDQTVKAENEWLLRCYSSHKQYTNALLTVFVCGSRLSDNLFNYPIIVLFLIVFIVETVTHLEDKCDHFTLIEPRLIEPRLIEARISWVMDVKITMPEGNIADVILFTQKIRLSISLPTKLITQSILIIFNRLAVLSVKRLRIQWTTADFSGSIVLTSDVEVQIIWPHLYSSDVFLATDCLNCCYQVRFIAVSYALHMCNRHGQTCSFIAVLDYRMDISFDQKGYFQVLNDPGFQPYPAILHHALTTVYHLPYHVTFSICISAVQLIILCKFVA